MEVTARPRTSQADLIDISAEVKAAALEAALRSETFSRSEQFRNFLRFICEKEIQGQAGDISEYLIGVEVLGRPEGYSITEDSSVRKRAYELRQKLDRLYTIESPDSAIRIAVPKGSYVPRFIRVTPGPEAPDTDVEPTAEPPVQATGKPSRRWTMELVAALIAALALGFGIGHWTAGARIAAPNPILTEAWGPLAGADSNPIVCIATNMHLLVWPHADSTAQLLFPAFPELYPLYRQHRPLPAGTPLVMEPAETSLAFGEVLATLQTSRTLSAFRANYQILPERLANMASLRNRNAVVIGVPVSSDAVAKLLARTPYTIEYDESRGDYVVLDRRKQRNGPPEFAQESGPPMVSYGLVTVVPSAGSVGRNRQTVVFSGIGAAGTNAAVEFFSSPDQLNAFRNRLGADGFPPAYQIVVRCHKSQGLLMSSEYAAHAVFQP